MLLEEIGSSLYLIGMIGIIINRRSIIRILMSVEVMMVGINMMFIGYSIDIDDIVGEIIVICVLTVVAAESAIGLGIVVVYYRIRGKIGMDTVNTMHG